MRDALLLGSLFVAGLVAVTGYRYITRATADVAADTAAGKADLRVAMAAAAAGAMKPSHSAWATQGSVELPPQVATTPEDQKRVAAVEALSKAPAYKAIPELQKVINSSHDEPEWRAALTALGTLAATQGDSDETIRNGLRETITHTSNEALILSAQETIDQIDRAIYEAATGQPATFDAIRGAPPSEDAVPLDTQQNRHSSPE